MSSRLEKITPVHGMKKLKDPSRSSLKGDEWLDWIITSSIPATEGLVDPNIFRIWKLCRKGIMLHLQSDVIINETRNSAKKCFIEAAKLMEEFMPLEMLTLCTHQIVIELDRQIDQTGPIKETMGQWIERVCKRVVEPTRRRRICNSPEQTIMRGVLIRFYLSCYEQEIRDISDFEPPKKNSKAKILDKGDGGCTLIGPYELNVEEKKQFLKYLEYNHNFDPNAQLPNINVLKFKRANYKEEYHSMEYTRVRSRNSTTAGIMWIMYQTEYFGRIHKFFKVELQQGLVLRLAFVTCYIKSHTRTSPLEHINQENDYKTGRMVDVTSLTRRVIFYGPKHRTAVLDVPYHYSN